MYLQRAFTLPFDDPRWAHKLLPLLPFSLFSLFPVFGLIPLALIIGWVVALVANIRQGAPRPLPEWSDVGRLIPLGAEVLLAIILMHLPIAVLFFIAWLLGSSIGSTFYSVVYNLGQLCCLIPLSLVYMLIAWILLGLGILDYSESLKREDLYRLRYHWDRARTHVSLVSGWLIRVLVITLIFALIPVIGWLLAAVIYWPVQGILLGELGRLMDGRIPRKKGY
jgi:hypothetical protein